MSLSRSTRKRRVISKLPQIVSSSPISLSSLFSCYDFVSPNEYSEKTFGILAFLLRRSVGEINFSAIIDEAEKLNQQNQSVDFLQLLEDKRKDLPRGDGSIEACLMLNRLISYIKENEKRFLSTFSHIRLDMKMYMTDNHLNYGIQYPEDFRQRETDFLNRKNAQDMRRFFYFNHTEAKKPPNLIYLKNRITEHLTYLIDQRMNYDPKLRDNRVKELEKIFSNSFMITSHPHLDVNPVIIYDRIGPGIYKAQVSVMIVSLLHDFMQTHPNLIELYDIEANLSPSSPHYKLAEPQLISWNTCHLQACLDRKPQIIQYAELSFITIEETNGNNTHVRFTQTLHTLKFNIKFHVNLTEYRSSKIHQVTLESLPFGICRHYNQIPQLIACVMLDDIRRFAMSSTIDVKTVVNFIQRYFIHRTGVKPNDNLAIYLEQELNKDRNERKNYRVSEDIFIDFLVPFVHQVEFMTKHPVLAMFYADGLFLGPCNSDQAAEAMMKLSDTNVSVIGLRFNSIRTDYKTIPETSALDRTIKIDPCAVRVDILNNHTNTIRYRTFDSSILGIDISRFISKALSENLSHIRVLCNFHSETNEKKSQSFSEFTKYYYIRLHELSKTDEKYKPITNLARNLDNEDSEDSFLGDNDNHSTNSSGDFAFISELIPPVSTATYNDEHSSKTNVHNDMLTTPDVFNINEGSSQNIPSTYEKQQHLNFLNNQEIVQYLFSQPDLISQVLHQFNDLNLTFPAAMAAQQQICDYSTLKTKMKDVSVQTTKKLPEMEISTEYVHTPPSASHDIQLHKTPTNSLVVVSTPACCAALVGLTLTTIRECDSNQNESIRLSTFQKTVHILIFYLGLHSLPSIKSSSTIIPKPELLENEWSCIPKLLAIKEQFIYFIVSAASAKIVIPLIHDQICIEHIYILQDGKVSQSSTWLEAYSKIRGTWSSIQEIEQQVERDTSSMGIRPARWSRTSDIFEELWTQKSSIPTANYMADDMKQNHEIPIIVTLCDIRPAPFYLSKDGVKTNEFSSIEDCRLFIEKQGTSSVFLIIIGDYNAIINEAKSLLEYNSIHAIYVFPVNNSYDKDHKSISVDESPKISGIFDQEQDLLLQIVADICFFRQISAHIPKMSILEIESDILSSLNEDKKLFLNFQFFLDILNQLWCAPDIPSEFLNRIETAGTELSSDLFMNNIQLTHDIDRLIKQFDCDTFIKASSRLRFINQHLESSVQKLYPSSITIYRAQLVTNEDLKTIQKNPNSLFAIHTLIFASRSFPSTQRICRRAYDNGLTPVLLEINIPKKMPLIYLDSDIIVFPPSTVFKIISTAIAPDKICHVQLKLADSTMDLIKEQLYYNIGEHLTWLTFGNYLSHIEKSDAAEGYFKYLLDTFPSDSREYASIYNNMSLMYLSMKDKEEVAFAYLKKAQNLIDSKNDETKYEEHYTNDDDKTDHYEKLAEFHEQQGDYLYACLFYEKAIKHTTDSTLCKIYQLKIETLIEKLEDKTT